jgi:hypothetical protein
MPAGYEAECFVDPEHIKEGLEGGGPNRRLEPKHVARPRRKWNDYDMLEYAGLGLVATRTREVYHP